jgi:5,10-methylene-tetrahydrofolate dehydrogenase/methenyl tetrahydrofolate cyclohydrolase
VTSIVNAARCSDKFDQTFFQVGDRKDSDVYIRQKQKAAADIGINAQLLKLPK